ncbi:hypothetical protein KDA10_02335 [candidate division WWE3 bacterium]|uniref:Uncharacterized protein n=1 Tax=candidate division WWE3 bacterium TaxID=2053526 RepID=A0A955IW69_UNCKA|nr:hypothetical protein [candidate division WWE3 bacterium]
MLVEKMLKIAHAQTSVPVTVVDPFSGSPIATAGTLAAIFGVVMNLVIGVGIALTVIFLGIAGIEHITAKGDTKKAASARTALTNALIGFLIVVGAITIKIIAQNVVGISGTNSGISGITPF